MVDAFRLQPFALAPLPGPPPLFYATLFFMPCLTSPCALAAAVSGQDPPKRGRLPHPPHHLLLIVAA